jgi:hypothetical protein
MLIKSRPGTRIFSKSILILAFIFALAYLTKLQNIFPSLYDSDGYYHLAFAKFIKTFGLRYPFHWMHFSVFTNNFADKDILFHTLLVPFLYLNSNPVIAGKIALFFLTALFLITYLSVLRKYVPDWLAAVIFILPLFSPLFTLYCLQLRSVTLSNTFTILITYFLISKKPRPVFIFTLLYTLTHISFFILIFIALACEILRYLLEKEFYAKNIFAVITAMILGMIIHPNFPNNLFILYLNGIVSPWYALSGIKQSLTLGEMLPNSTKIALITNPTVFLALGAAFWLMLLKRKKPDLASCVWFAVLNIYLALAFIATRFWHQVNIFAFIFFAAYIGALMREEDWRKHFMKIAALASVLLLAAFVSIGFSNKYLLDSMDFFYKRNMHFEEIGRWMDKNIPPGETIYHSYWDDAHFFICFNPKDDYLSGLDPIYTYWRYPQEFVIQEKLSLARIAQPKEIFEKVFKARYGFLRKGEPLYWQVRNDKADFKVLYENPEGLLFSIYSFQPAEHPR